MNARHGDEARFSAEVRRDARCVELALRGELNALAEAQFEAAAARALAGAPRQLLLDFSGLTYINSTGIALIVGLLGRARAARTLVRGSGLDAHHRHLFEITRLSDLIRLDDETADQPAGGSPDE